MARSKPPCRCSLMRSSLSITIFALVIAACSAGVPGSTQTRSAPVANAVFAVSEPRELLPDEQVQQVLNRLAFGARPGDAEKVRAMGIDRWIALQLTPDRIDDAAAEQLTGHYETLNARTTDLIETYRQVQQARRREQMQLRADGDTTASKQDAR